MEKPVDDSRKDLLPGGRDVPFDRLTASLSSPVGFEGGTPGARALTATVVAVGPAPRLGEAVGALESLGAAIGLRSVLIAIDCDGPPVHRMQGAVVALGGLKPSFVNNAVAALRLSSLPTVVWWRGGPADLLPALARLADRVVLDEESPHSGWRQAATLLAETAFGDLRWTRLTRWRSLMAQLFEVPDVRAAGEAFSRLDVSGSDAPTSALFASWLRRALGVPLQVRFERRDGPALRAVTLGDGAQHVSVRLAASGVCVTTRASVRGHDGASKTVSFGDQSLPALLAEELRVRARDRAFEEAVVASLEAAR